MPRTEEQKICQAPIVVVLGGQEYDVEPLVIRESRAWRAEVAKLMAVLPKYAGVTTDDPSGFADAMTALLVQMPDTVVDLFFSYAKKLDRIAIEEVATDTEMAKAFEQVVEIGFPLAVTMMGAMQKLSR